MPGGGFWIDCQTRLMTDYQTRFVIPLVPLPDAPRPSAARLNPVLEFAGAPHALLTQFAGTVPIAELGSSAGSLAHERYAILNAIDFLVTGI